MRRLKFCKIFRSRKNAKLEVHFHDSGEILEYFSPSLAFSELKSEEDLNKNVGKFSVTNPFCPEQDGDARVMHGGTNQVGYGPV